VWAMAQIAGKRVSFTNVFVYFIQSSNFFLKFSRNSE
jgi:hypothetical protein